MSALEACQLGISTSPKLPAAMAFVPGGTFTFGSDHFYPEEGPARQVRVDPFFMDETPVTNFQFARFIEATRHVSWAEFPPDPRSYPGMRPDVARAGSAVFVKPDRPVDLHDPSQWWSFVFGADWRHPAGPESTIEDRWDHPVVHVSFSDAEAYARWAGRTLPTEAEWEFAARAGLQDADYAWGNELAPEEQPLANYWRGRFPTQVAEGDWAGTSPVVSYPANAYGLFDLIGNVWEWTADWYAPHKLERKAKGSCCIPANPRGGRRHDSIALEHGGRVPCKVLKGGSHLCAENYCQRYRPAARHPEPVDTTAGHVGFRCVKRIPASL